MTAGKTYYIYTTESAVLNGLKSMDVTSYESYTIHYKDGEGTTIKDDVVHDGLLGASVSASGSDLDAIVYDEKTYAYSSGNTPITLTTGVNEITLVYEEAGEHDYTVNAVAGGTTLKELATGSAVESMDYSVSNLPLVIEKDGNYYALTDAAVSGYTKTFTMGSSDEVKTVEYTLDESIAYFAEGEVLYPGQLISSADCSNGAYTFYLHGLTSTFSLSAGWYRMETVVKDREGKNPLNIYKEDGTELGTIAKGGSKGFRQTELFRLDATSNVKIGLTDPSNNNSPSFDYVLVRRFAVPANDYYLKNKATGAYFAAGLSWGTQAITNTQGHRVGFVLLPSGKYNLNTYIYRDQKSTSELHYLADNFCDSGVQDWTISDAGDGYFTLSNSTGKLTGGAVNAALSITSGTGDNTKWQILTAAERKADIEAQMAGATATNGVDATFYITDPDFAWANLDDRAAWQGSPSVNGFDNKSSGRFLNGEKYTDPYATFDVYQALTGVKPGVYKLTMQGFYRNGLNNVSDANDNLAKLYANSSEVALKNIRYYEYTDDSHSGEGFTTDKSGYYVPNSQEEAAKTFNAGYFENELYVVVGEDGNLRIGVKKDAATGADKDWAVFDNFKLTYYGTSVSATIGSTGWTTFSSGYALDLSNMTASEGEVTAYYASETSADAVIMTSTNSSAVIANEGLMLKGTAGATITIPVTASAGSALDGNMLVGCYEGEEVGKDEHKYVLVNNGGTAEFQCLDKEGAIIPAGKAYLNLYLASSARALRIAFSDDVTGINETEAATEAVAKEGKFIENGKLVIVKNGKKYNANGIEIK